MARKNPTIRERLQPIARKIKRYLYYEKKVTEKLDIKTRLAVDLFFKDQKIPKPKSYSDQIRVLLNLKATRGNAILVRRTIRKPRKKKSRLNYKNYLQSEQWREKREMVFRFNGRQCVHCGSEKRLHVHHVTYENLGNEKLEDLMVLCESCHAEEHKRLKKINKYNHRDKKEVKYKRNGALIEK